MGICASKSDKVESTRPAQAAKPRVKKTSGLSKTVVKSSSLRNGSGHRVNGEVDDIKDKVSAQEAARLAAEKRLEESTAKSTQGALGKKLAEERSKSHKSHMMKEVEKRQMEKASQDMVYN